MSKPARFLSFFFLLTLFVSAAAAPSKNYYFPEVRVDLNIDEDGTFTVDEYRTYEFQGSFTWASLWIPIRIDREKYRYDVSIDEFGVYEQDGQPLRVDISEKGDRFEVKWFYEARDERRTFHIRYRVKGGIISYPDVTELYWQVIGNDLEKPTGNVLVHVHLPGPVSERKDLRVFGHGPLSGMSGIVDEKTARFTVRNLPAFQFVEIRVIWPSGLVKGVPSERHTLNSILEEEGRFVRETIEKARLARESEERKEKLIHSVFGAWVIWFILAPIIWLLIFFISWKRTGQDYRFRDMPDYHRELPSGLRPALVEMLLREGRTITPASFTATLFDLARRGYIEIEDKGIQKKGFFSGKQNHETTITCRLNYKNDSGIVPYERSLLNLLFVNVGKGRCEKGAGLKLDGIKMYLKKKPQAFQEWFKNWQKMVQSEAKKLRLIEPESLKIHNIFLAVTLPLAFFTLNLPLVVLTVVLAPTVKRRAENWARENELWKALKRFLDDFSNFKDLPPEAYKLWEHYLVFGILFGNAKKIIKMLPIILSDERAASPVWYVGFDRAAFSAGGRIDSMVRSIESMSTSIRQASTSADHYSRGGGGGFSSGGGGGGGGGGGRAG